MNENLTIYISQPMENNSRTDRLFEHTKNNCYEMYPSATINSFPTEDSRQKDIWNSIYFNRDSLGIVCVISAGHIFLEPNKTFELVLEQTKGKTWWALGHMLDRTNEGTYRGAQTRQELPLHHRVHGGETSAAQDTCGSIKLS